LTCYYSRIPEEEEEEEVVVTAAAAVETIATLANNTVHNVLQQFFFTELSYGNAQVK